MAQINVDHIILSLCPIVSCGATLYLTQIFITDLSNFSDSDWSKGGHPCGFSENDSIMLSFRGTAQMSPVTGHCGWFSENISMLLFPDGP